VGQVDTDASESVRRILLDLSHVGLRWVCLQRWQRRQYGSGLVVVHRLVEQQQRCCWPRQCHPSLI
jgi:hypothetical protein